MCIVFVCVCICVHVFVCVRIHVDVRVHDTVDVMCFVRDCCLGNGSASGENKP